MKKFTYIVIVIIVFITPSINNAQISNGATPPSTLFPLESNFQGIRFDVAEMMFM